MDKFTRRELAAGLSTAAVVLARPQSQAQPGAANPADELTASRTQLRDGADQMDKFPLPMSTEPATTFKP
jgi:hypothetical protein